MARRAKKKKEKKNCCMYLVVAIEKYKLIRNWEIMTNKAIEGMIVLV